MKKCFDYPVGYVSLAILREEYKQYILRNVENGRYVGDFDNLVKYETLERILKPLEQEDGKQ